MNKNSIFFKITLFFILLIIIIHTIIYIGYSITKQEQIDLLVNRYMKTLFQVHHNNKPSMPMPPLEIEPFFDTMPPPPPPKFFQKLSKETFNKILKPYDLQLSNVSLKELNEQGKLLAEDFQWQLYEYKGYKYFYRHEPIGTLLLKDMIQMPDKTTYLSILTFLLNSMFILFYLYLFKTLRPLKALTNSVIAFSKGNLLVDTSTNNKDEIGQLSNEFHNAIVQIRELTESRNLFLRNIMHELKTPITKGKLQTDLLESEKQKHMFKRVFERLEYLLFEFAKIEQLTSHNIQLKRESYRAVDLLDQAIDILMISKKNLEIKVEDNLVIEVDFHLFALVLKNLIDNALKYGGQKALIEINATSICIKNIGEPLKGDIQNYSKPFNREYEASSQSLGLGLYIVQTILKLHGLMLHYSYKENENTFCIEFINN